MKTETIYIFIASSFLLILTLIGCKEQSPLKYEEEPALHFAHASTGEAGSLTYSFFIKPEGLNRDTVYVPILAMGTKANHDRAFVIKQTNEDKEDAAIAGVHFVKFDDPEMANQMIMPAEKYEKLFPIIVLRDSSLIKKTVRIELEIVENENFKIGINKWAEFMVDISAMPLKPKNWIIRWQWIFKDWGPVKMKFIMEKLNFYDFDLDEPISMDLARFYTSEMKQHLINYNNEHPDNPLKEDDGTLVSFN